MSNLAQLLRPELAELRAYVPAEPAGITVRLDANEAPAPRTGAVREAITAALAGLAFERYPDVRAERLRAQLAARTGTDARELVVGSGSDEVIAMLLSALSRPRPGKTAAWALTVTPTFVMYRHTARVHGLDVREVPLDDAWDLDVPGLLAAIDETRPNVVFIASPNNPTGNAMTEARLVRVIEAASDAVVVIDEAYVDYADGSLRGLRARYPQLAVLRTLSKIGLAALRVGWVEADAELVAELEKVRQPYNVSATSQAAAAAVLEHAWHEVERDVALVKAERERVARAIGAMGGFAVTPSRANFLWVHSERPAKGLWEALAREGILVRSFDAAGGRLASQLRITVGTPDENDRLLAALERTART